MDLERFAEYTNRVLNNVSGSSSFHVSKDVLSEIEQMNRDNTPSANTSITKFTAGNSTEFKIPSGVSSMPYITGFDDDKVSLITHEPSSFKTNTNSRLSNTLRANNLIGFRGEIQNINRAAFSNGIDFDNFALLNMSNAPLRKNVIKNILQYGAILPLGSRHGIFMPNFAFKNATFNSIEYEGRFVPNDYRNPDIGIDVSSFKSAVIDVAKADFGIDVGNLLTHSAGSSVSYDAHGDVSIGSRPGTKTKEIVFGAAPTSNLIMAMHTAFASWEKHRAIRNEDRVMSRETGMHINSTLRNLLSPTDERTASNYLNHSGVIIDVLARNKTRWSSYDYLGIKNKYDSNRSEFRLESHINRLENRYPGIIFDIGHIANQLIMSNKITGDTDNYMATTNIQRTENIVNYGTNLGGNQANALRTLSALHDNTKPEYSAMNEWFNKYMDIIGVNDDFSKQFVKMINAKCLKA